MKTITLVVLLVTGLFYQLPAEDKYEFARVEFVNHTGSKNDGIYLSVSGKATQKIEFEKIKLNDYVDDYTPLLNYLQTLSDQGWEIVTVTKNRTTQHDAFYLKRKKEK